MSDHSGLLDSCRPDYTPVIRRDLGMCTTITKSTPAGVALHQPAPECILRLRKTSVRGAQNKRWVIPARMQPRAADTVGNFSAAVMQMRQLIYERRCPKDYSMMPGLQTIEAAA